MLLLYNTDYPLHLGPTLSRTWYGPGSCRCPGVRLASRESLRHATIIITTAAPPTHTPATPTAPTITTSLALLLGVGVTLMSSTVIATVPTVAAATNATTAANVVTISTATATTVLPSVTATADGGAATGAATVAATSARAKSDPPLGFLTHFGDTLADRRPEVLAIVFSDDPTLAAQPVPSKSRLLLVKYVRQRPITLFL